MYIKKKLFSYVSSVWHFVLPLSILVADQAFCSEAAKDS